MSKENKNSDPASTEKENNNKKVRGIVSEITKSTGDAILKPEKIKESEEKEESTPDKENDPILKELNKLGCKNISEAIAKVKELHASINERDALLDLIIRKKVNGRAKDLLSIFEINTYDDSKEPVSVTLVEALHKIQRDDQEYDPVELRNKVPSLRFADMADDNLSKVHEDEKKTLKEYATSIWTDYGIQVRLIEKIDVKDTSLKKFYIRLTDKNGNYIELDLLDYQKKIYDFTEDEEETLKNKIVDLKGVYDGNTMKAASDIAKYISLALKYKEYFWYQYDRLGWDDIYIDNVCHKIFKYNTIYSRNDLKIQGFCDRDWSSYLEPHGPGDEEGSEEIKWSNRFYWYVIMAQVFTGRPIPDILLSVGASGVIRDLLTPNKETNLNINIVAPAASGKSTLENVILSFYGRPDYLMGTFSDTDSAVDEIRGIRNVIPYVVDDRMLKVQTNGDTKKAYTLLMDIFREYNGKEKSRIGASNNISLSASGAVISSTTQSILKVINEQYEGYDYGQSRRFIEFELQPEDMFKDAELAEVSNNMAHVCYGYGIQQMIETILLIDNCVELSEIIKLYKDKKIDDYKNTIKITCLQLTSYDEEPTYDSSVNNVEKLFRIIKNYVDDTIEKVDFTSFKLGDDIKEEDNKNLKIELTAMSQRFTMILLSGFIVDISMDILRDEIHDMEEYADYIEQLDNFDINLQGMLDELIKNHVRLYYNRKNISKQAEKENIRRQQIEAIEKKKKDNKLAEDEAKLAEEEERKALEIAKLAEDAANKTVKTLEYKRQTVDLYDWILNNLSLFWDISDGANNSTLDENKVIGNYTEDAGNLIVRFSKSFSKKMFGLLIHGERDVNKLREYAHASNKEDAHKLNRLYGNSMLEYDEKDYEACSFNDKDYFTAGLKKERAIDITFNSELIDQYRKELNEGDDDHASN